MVITAYEEEKNIKGAGSSQPCPDVPLAQPSSPRDPSEKGPPPPSSSPLNPFLASGRPRRAPFRNRTSRSRAHEARRGTPPPSFSQHLVLHAPGPRGSSSSSSWLVPPPVGDSTPSLPPPAERPPPHRAPPAPSAPARDSLWPRFPAQKRRRRRQRRRRPQQEQRRRRRSQGGGTLGFAAIPLPPPPRARGLPLIPKSGPVTGASRSFPALGFPQDPLPPGLARSGLRACKPGLPPGLPGPHSHSRTQAPPPPRGTPYPMVPAPQNRGESNPESTRRTSICEATGAQPGSRAQTPRKLAFAAAAALPRASLPPLSAPQIYLRPRQRPDPARNSTPLLHPLLSLPSPSPRRSGPAPSAAPP
ncbi:basic proline-rich protein-like [Phodopus roborovskii]|uniref:basic proline-rich protein-like n=1 Tax=Phodopus roborovskii TaxID=109678 RepID=UPI0021E43EC2|nr:basic proline-rich protein-like [Phodopus roborovskii]